MKRFAPMLIAISAILSACSYEQDPNPVTPESQIEDDASADGRKHQISKEVKFLTDRSSKKWHATNYFIGGVDYTFLFAQCSLDNIQIFDIQGNYIGLEGATKCDPAAPDIFDQGTYEFADNNTHFLLNASHLQVDFTIVELKPNSFKLKYLDPALGEVEFWLVPVKNNCNTSATIHKNISVNNNIYKRITNHKGVMRRLQ